MTDELHNPAARDPRSDDHADSVSGSHWSAPEQPTWSPAPQGWPPAVPVAPPSAPFGSTARDDRAAFASGGAPPAGFAGPPPLGPNWNSGDGPTSWGPPPAASPSQTGARRAIAVIAVVALILASAAVGAAISSAVHSTKNASSNGSASSLLPGANGADNGGLGFGNGSASGNIQAPANRASGTGNPRRGVVSKVDPAVVDIYTTITAGGATGQAAGTGMIITPSGEVLTNNHVIDGATSIRVQLVNTGATYSARVIGYDRVHDVALVQIDGVSNLPTVHFAAASSIGIGDSVTAIGNALGQGGTPTATAGSITALDQQVTAGDQTTGNTETLHGMIQIDALIQPGDSGGPLVNTNGNVIGMNTAATQNVDFSGQSGSTTAFAIPANTARHIAQQIEAGTNTTTVHIGERGILGVSIAPDNLAPNSTGATIAQVQPNSPADTAGLTAGDTITSLNGKPVTNRADLTTALFPYHPNDRITMNWIDQSGQQHQQTLQLTAGPPT